MDTNFPAQSGWVKAWFAYPLKFLAYASGLFILCAMPVVAQTNQLIVSTVAGLANFGSADGINSVAKFYYPAGVAVDGAGNVYVADAFNDTIRKVSAAGVVTTLAGQAQMPGTNDGAGSLARFNRPYGVAVDIAGNVYVADTFNSTIREITPNGVVTTIAGKPSFNGYHDGSAIAIAQFNFPYGIAVDSTSNIYVADTDNNLLRKLANGVVTTLAGDSNNLTSGTNDGQGGAARFSQPVAVATDSAGNIYVADYGSNLIRFVTPAGYVTNIAGSGGTTFSSPIGVAVDSASNVYVSDYGNQIVRELTYNGTRWSLLANATFPSYSGTLAGYPGFSYDSDGTNGVGTFDNPWGVAVDSATNVYVGDSYNGNIREIIAADTNYLSTLAGPDGSYGDISTNVTTTAQARFNQPNGVAVDSSGNIYVVDTANSCIEEVTAAGTVSILAGSTNGITNSMDGTNYSVGFNFPLGLCIDSSTNIYVADTFNFTVRKITLQAPTNWVSTTYAGQAGMFGFSNLVGTNALFYSPAAVAVDNSTNVYVADTYNVDGTNYINTIRMIAPNGQVSTLAGSATNSAGLFFIGQYVDGIGTNAFFNRPVGLAVYVNGSITNVYVADSGNNAIRRITNGGVVSTLAKGGLINNPQGVAVDTNGNVYVANSGNNTILGISAPGGVVTNVVVIAGTSNIVGSADGLGPAAQFANPVGLAVDASTNIYVADMTNNTIRKGTPNTGQTVMLKLDTLPSGFPVEANGTNYPATPQVLAIPSNTSIAVTVATSNSYVVSNTFAVTNDFIFTNWTSNGTAVNAPTNYTFTLSSNETLVANYSAYMVTVTASPTIGGTVSGGGSFEANSSVTVTATTNTGYAFTGWTSNTVPVSLSNYYTFTLTTNVNLVANFTNLYAYIDSASPANGGTVTPSGTNLAGNSITVIATNSPGFVFTNWTSNGVYLPSVPTNYTFTLGTNVTNVAHFLPLYNYTNSASPAIGGTVSPGGTNVVVGTSITIIATNNPGFVFGHWTSNGVTLPTAPTNYTFTLGTNITNVAVFLPLYTYTNIASPANGGTVSHGGTNSSGTQITVKATNSPGFVFTNWTSNGVVVTNSTNYIFTIGANVTNTANFLPLYAYINSASPAGGGTVSHSGTNVVGAQITVNATNNPGFAFGSWTSNGVVVANTATYTFTLGINVTNVASFLPLYTYIDAASPANGGTVSPGGTNVVGTQITVTATNNVGYVFTVWTSNGIAVVTSNSYTFTLGANVTNIADFVASPSQQIEVFSGTNLNANNLIVNGQATPVNYGSVLQTQAQPTLIFTVTNSGSQTVALTGITVPSGYTLVSNAPSTITNFPWAIAPGGSGTFGVQFDLTQVGVNSGPVIIAVANNGILGQYAFPITGTVNSVPSESISLNVSPANGGTASANGTPGGGTFPLGSLLSLTAMPNSNFVFVAWTGDATGKSNPLPVTLTTTLNITANFATNATNITLTIATNGNGAVKVSPKFTGQFLKKGSSYTLKAVPTAGSGYVFAGWTGSITTNKNPLTVKMTNSMALQVNFVPNPFPPFVGTYNGLFVGTNGVVAEETAGMIKGLRVASNGIYSGKLYINGTNHGLSGTFNLDGAITNPVIIHGKHLQVVMTLNGNNPLPQVTGTVSGPDGVADLTALLASNSLLSAEYTMLIPPATNNAPDPSPIGDGYASITNHAGTATLTGALADGTAFNQTVSVSEDDYVPIYANLYNGTGLLLGWISLDLTNTDGVSLTWIHPARPSGLFRTAFTNILLTNQILLSPWTDSSATMDFLAIFTNLLTIDSIPNTNTTSFPLAISSSGEIGPAHTLSGFVKPKTGVFTVTFHNGASTATGHGAILVNTTNGGGYFQTPTSSGAVKVPAP